MNRKIISTKKSIAWWLAAISMIGGYLTVKLSEAEAITLTATIISLAILIPVGICAGVMISYYQWVLDNMSHINIEEKETPKTNWWELTIEE
jgi:hypothetical protein